MELIKRKCDELEVSFAGVHVHVHNVGPSERKKNEWKIRMPIDNKYLVIIRR